MAQQLKNLLAMHETQEKKDSILGLGRSSGEGNCNPLQYSCLGNPINRGAWRAIVQWVCKESDTKYSKLMNIIREKMDLI